MNRYYYITDEYGGLKEDCSFRPGCKIGSYECVCKCHIYQVTEFDDDENWVKCDKLKIFQRKDKLKKLNENK